MQKKVEKPRIDGNSKAAAQHVFSTHRLTLIAYMSVIKSETCTQNVIIEHGKSSNIKSTYVSLELASNYNSGPRSRWTYVT